MSRKDKPEMYQSVHITLSDGTKACYVGKAVVFPTSIESRTIVDVAFTPPKPMPAGCKFEQIENENS